jgi:hypothetical protein
MPGATAGRVRLAGSLRPIPRQQDPQLASGQTITVMPDPPTTANYRHKVSLLICRYHRQRSVGSNPLE